MFPCCCAQPESEHFLLSTMVGIRYDSLCIRDKEGNVLIDTGAELYPAQITPLGLFALRRYYPRFAHSTTATPFDPYDADAYDLNLRLGQDENPYTRSDVLADREECDFPGYAPHTPYLGTSSWCRDLCPDESYWFGDPSTYRPRRWWHPTLDCLVQWSISNLSGENQGPFLGTYRQEYFPYKSTDEEESYTIRGVFMNWLRYGEDEDPPHDDCLAQYKLLYPVELAPPSEGGPYSNWYGITLEHRSYVEPINMEEGCLPAPFNQSLADLAAHPNRHLNRLMLTDEGLRAAAMQLAVREDYIDWQVFPYVNDVTPGSHSVLADFTPCPVSAGANLSDVPEELDSAWVHDDGGTRKGSIYKRGYRALDGTVETLPIGPYLSTPTPATVQVYGWCMAMLAGASNVPVLVAAARFPDAPYELSHEYLKTFTIQLRIRLDVWEHFSNEETDRACPYNSLSAGLVAPESMAASLAPYTTKQCYAVWTEPTDEYAWIIRLHTDDPGEGGGANEYSGGGYAGLTPSWKAASGGYRELSSPLVFGGVASASVTWASLWGFDFDEYEYVWLGNAELQGDTTFGLDGQLTMLADSTKYAVL